MYPVCECGHRYDHHRDHDIRNGACWRCDCASYEPRVEKDVEWYGSDAERQYKQGADAH